MLTTILDILSIIGIVLLIILICAVVVLSLVLFLPIVYRSKGYKQDKEIDLWIKARWLFGFITLYYAYPTPKAVIVKCLGIEIYNSTKSEAKNNPKDSLDAKQHETESNVDASQKTNNEATSSQNQQDNVPASTETQHATQKNETPSETQPTDEQVEDVADETKKSLIERLKAKSAKIKYTIHSIYDKIKHIIQNIAYYKNVFQEEETKQLFQHVALRVRKIWKNIHPRKIKATIHFGTGSPDTTGYLCGVYGMICTYLGNSVIVQPDFELQILEGDFYVAGHITVFQILFHGGAILLDKKLHLFWKKIKQGGNSKNGR